jgi:hypothetical protein
LLAKDNDPSGREKTVEDNSESCDANKIIANPNHTLRVYGVGIV